METKISEANIQKILTKLIKSDKIKKTYELYIVKDIPYEKWVEDNMNRLLKERGMI